MHHPRLAGERMAAAPRPAFWISFGCGVFVLAAGAVCLTVWGATHDVRVGHEPAAPGRSPAEGTREVGPRTFGDVWRDWHAAGPIGRAEVTLCLVSLLVVGCAALCAWLQLPVVHRRGSVWQSYKRSFRGVASGVGLLALLVLLIGTGIVVHLLADQRGRMAQVWPRPPVDPSLLLAIGSCAALALVIWWVGRAVRGARAPAPMLDLPPRCEGCGYDLTHVSTDRRCTECGLPVDVSLQPDVRRTGCNWEHSGGTSAWLRAAFAVILSPGDFYGRLRLRSPGEAGDRFARRHYLVIGLGAGTWVFLVAAMEAPGRSIEDLLLLPMFMSLVVALLGWATHRIIGALAVSWWLFHHVLPDFRWARRVLAYETACLWIFCLYNGLLITSYIAFRNWISTSLRGPFGSTIFGMFLEVAALLFGSGILCIAWFWRYRVIARAIRWSNF